MFKKLPDCNIHLFSMILFMGLLLPLNTWSQQPKGLFDAQVTVKTQNSQEREKAARNGLAKVLVRMSGTTRSLDNPQVKSRIRNASRYLDRFEYIESSRDQALRGFPLVLSMRFLPTVVEQILRESGEPYWPPKRPPVLSWIVFDDPKRGKQILTDINHPVIRGLKAAAMEKGLSIKLPLYDLQDQSQIDESQLWSFNDLSIISASQRYNASVVLVGRVTMNSRNQYLSTWQYLHQERPSLSVDERTSNTTDLALSILTPLASDLASRYAINTSSQASNLIRFQIENIGTFQHYRKLLDYLESLAIINNVQVTRLESEQITLTIDSATEIERLLNRIELDRKLKRIQLTDAVGFNSQETAPILFRWR